MPKTSSQEQLFLSPHENDFLCALLHFTEKEDEQYYIYTIYIIDVKQAWV